MTTKDSPIGFFDSGVGGISILRAALEMLPQEDYIYFGDSVNAPYGTKSANQVQELSQKNVSRLLEMGVKAVVIACNTATAAAANYVRKIYPHEIIIGIEPEIKPAVLENAGKRILVMATPRTLQGENFVELLSHYKELAEVIPVPCDGLMEYVEQGILNGEELETYLRGKLSPYCNKDVAAVVLGCTHYPFVDESIKNVIGANVKIYEGSEGTVRQLKRRLEEKDLLSSEGTGKVLFYNSSEQEEMINLSKKLLEA